ncbi:ATP synthase regulation protein NCA2-domain-containing protein [Russula vinacea]|nr:ATP synthase regulation protein NCA2-domain-containing protein [Russula vinacea]
MITDELILSSSLPQWKISQASPEPPTAYSSNDVLRSLFLTKGLEDDDKLVGRYASLSIDGEEQALKDAVLSRLVVAVYAEALNTLLSEAITAEVEAQWWADLERSRLRVAYYLVQTLPLRIFNLFGDVLHKPHSNNQHISFSVFKPSSIRDLHNDLRDTGRSHSIRARMFPHLRTHSSLVPPPLVPLGVYRSILSYHSLCDNTSLVARYILHYVTLPFQLASQEIHVKRLELERIRDERAEALGELTSKHDDISRTLREDLDQRAAFLQVINQVLVGQHLDKTNLGTPSSLLDALDTTSSKVLPMHASLHKEDLHTYSLLRPSRLVRIWPSLLVLPPLTLYAIQRIRAVPNTLLSLAKNALERPKGFWRGWFIEPLTEIARTVRTGGEGSIISQKGNIDADLQSLERMVRSLAKDKLKYSSTQLDDLSDKLRLGDLTPLLQIYEDIKGVRSGFSGTLLRSALIQFQKARVDVDLALAGINKLLKSQELTFAFVGVGPALSLVHVVGGYLCRLFASRRDHVGGGRRRRTAAWLTLRRIERLLITQQRTRRDHHHHTHAKEGHHNAEDMKGAIPPLTMGLLLLSASSLREYVETWIPSRSRLREGFSEDIGDLEDPRLGREEKMRVVERMWRSWGHELGWERHAVEVST